VNVNHVVAGSSSFPDVVQNHGPRHHATFVAAKIFQQGKLCGSIAASAAPRASRRTSQAASRLTADAQIQFAGRGLRKRFSILRAIRESKCFVR